MFKWVFTLAAGLYAGFVIYGQPTDGVASAGATAPVMAAAPAESEGGFAQPVVLTAQPAVTRGAEPDTALLAAASTSPEAAFSAQPRLVGEPMTVSLVQPAAAPEPAAAAAAEAEGPLLRVTGSRVNLRAGPGVANGVVGSLTRGTVTEAIGEPVSGWQEIRDVETGVSGFMSANFLEPA